MTKVLIVDDDVINTKLFAKRLVKRGFEICVVHSGAECLEHLEKDHSWVVILDIVMPKMDGVEVLNRIRSKWEQMETPVIMVSSNDETEQVVDCLNKKASDYITKPVNIDIACARITLQSNLQSLYIDSLKKKQFETINSMVITFNHEINNPLTIALGSLKRDFSKITEKRVTAAVDALNRISDIVKKIENVTKKDMIEEEVYVNDSKMIKLI